MFEVDTEQRRISFSRGDTGAVRFRATAKRRDTGADYVFGERDRAVFTCRSGSNLLKERAYPIVNNMFTVYFFNKDSDTLPAGTYSWDVRYVINPYYEDDPPEGTWPDYGDLTFPVAKGDKCMHGGTYYTANQAIASSEEWTPEHWDFADFRIPVDGDQVVTPHGPMEAGLLAVVGDI